MPFIYPVTMFTRALFSRITQIGTDSIYYSDNAFFIYKS